MVHAYPLRGHRCLLVLDHGRHFVDLAAVGFFLITRTAWENSVLPPCEKTGVTA